MPSYQDISRQTSNVALPVEVSNEIWANAIHESAFMQLGRQIALPGTGTSIQAITAEPEADWTLETNAKPVGFHTFGKKVMTPYKLAVIEPFSNEFMRSLAQKYGRSIAQICIRWSFQTGCVPLPKSVTEERIIENSKIFDFEIAPADCEKIANLQDTGIRPNRNPDEAEF